MADLLEKVLPLTVAVPPLSLSMPPPLPELAELLVKVLSLTRRRTVVFDAARQGCWWGRW